MKVSDKQFLKLFHNNLIGLMLSDEDHIIVDVNEHLLQLIGVKSTDIIGKKGIELPILNDEFVKKYWQCLLTEGRVLNHELSFKSKKTNEVDMLFSTEKIELDDKSYWLTTVVDITKRKKTEEALSNVYERVTDAFVAIDKNWCYTYVNKKAGELLEKDPAYLVGKHIWTEFSEEIGQPVYLAYHEAMENQQMISMERYYEPHDRWFQNLIYPSPDGLSVFFNDITKKKRVDGKIRGSELRFRTLTRTAPVGIFETDAAGLTTYVNETWIQLSGMNFKDAMGNGWLKAVYPEDRKNLIDNWQNKSAKSESSFSEYRMIDNKGKLRWVKGNAVPVINSEGVVTGYIGTISDVTEIKNAIELLKKKEEALTKAQKISKVGSWEFLLSTGELIWSEEQYRIFELEGEPAETLYEAYRNKYHSDDLIKLDAVINNAVEKAEGFTYEHRIICKDGSIKYILSIGEVVLDENGKVVGMKGIGQDTTAQKLGEQKLQERTEQLKELSTHLQKVREEERTSIAREIHDELGQQLTGLKMDIAWLKKKVDQDDTVIKTKFEEALLLVDATVKSIRRITSELRPSIIDDLGLNAAVEWLVAEFSERLTVEIKYENNFDDKNINPDISIGLFRILQESLTNIAKHARATKITISIVNERDTIRLLTEDNGVGFDSTVKSNQPTFGLLGIKERTHMLKGEYSIFTKPGKGTKIEIKIPL